MSGSNSGGNSAWPGILVAVIGAAGVVLAAWIGVGPQIVINVGQPGTPTSEAPAPPTTAPIPSLAPDPTAAPPTLAPAPTAELPTAGLVPTSAGDDPFFEPPTPAPELLPTPNVGAVEPAPLPPNNTCPYDARGGWLAFQNTWYGPYAGGQSISYDLQFFYVYDPNQYNSLTQAYGNVTSYSTAFERNRWTRLIGSPMWVCVDTPGNVYAAYAP
jgi:hypothetical protein